MKRIAVITLVLLVALMAVATAQPVKNNPNTVPQYFYQPINTAKAYANSQTDTMTVYYRLGGATRLSYSITVNDSASLKVYVYYRYTSTASWTLKDSVTVTNTTDAGTTTEWILRDHSTEKIPGVIPWIRFKKAWQGSANGVTSATYSDQINWKP